MCVCYSFFKGQKHTQAILKYWCSLPTKKIPHESKPQSNSGVHIEEQEDSRYWVRYPNHCAVLSSVECVDPFFPDFSAYNRCDVFCAFWGGVQCEHHQDIIVTYVSFI